MLEEALLHQIVQTHDAGAGRDISPQTAYIFAHAQTMQVCDRQQYLTTCSGAARSKTPKLSPSAPQPARPTPVNCTNARTSACARRLLA
jgi:hypothetical protein